MMHKIVLFFVVFCGLVIPSPVTAQNLTLIRDTEIESTIKKWVEPVILAAGLRPDGVNIILVGSSEVNAFVAGGANIFLYTGLIEKTENPSELIGVIAHELGHISGGHLVRLRDAVNRASYESILGMLLGVGAAIATGDGQAAAAVSLGARSMAERRFLSHNRVQESSADQAAVRYLERAGMDPSGLLNFLKKLEGEEFLPQNRQSEYMRTHPLTRNRIDAVAQAAEKSLFLGKALPAQWQDEHDRMKAKLVGFLSPERVPWTYSDRDTSVPARMARTIAAYRRNQVQDALSGMDALIRTEPDNPWFQELKGQMLVDFGRTRDALPYYRRAAEMEPDSGLIRTALAHALIETAGQDNQALLREAVTHLEKAEKEEPRYARIHRLLATAYGRLGQNSLARLHLAEEALMLGRHRDARRHAQAAIEALEHDRPRQLKAQDVLNALDNLGIDGEDF